LLVEAAAGAATGAGTGAGLDGSNMKVGFGERISTGAVIDAGAGAGAGAVAGGDVGTEERAAAGAANTIGLLTVGCTGAGGGT
jgi:hypothetical protein